mmetsp:Transcript_119941/g.267939  ORF Transcript_119941/g.267939 Transcript_119941/m.267939 type:complete len:99 (+) Transcript_119941:1-297(+)
MHQCLCCKKHLHHRWRGEPINPTASDLGISSTLGRVCGNFFIERSKGFETGNNVGSRKNKAARVLPITHKNLNLDTMMLVKVTVFTRMWSNMTDMARM